MSPNFGNLVPHHWLKDTRRFGTTLWSWTFLSSNMRPSGCLQCLASIIQRRFAILHKNGDFNCTAVQAWKCIRKVQPTIWDVSQCIYFCKTLYLFQTAFPSVIRSSNLHIQSQVFVRPLLLPAASRQAVWQIPDPVCAVLSSWWWTGKPSETCRASCRNKEIKKRRILLVVLCGYIGDRRTYEHLIKKSLKLA